VKFTEEEHERIARDARESGKSIPTLLKIAYFAGRQLRILMSKEDQTAWFRELRSCGNNLNQIARKLNAGAEAGWHHELVLISAALQSLQAKVCAVSGRR
jgi:hypothetical protein